ncbi:unnamed protein product [Euphydryas editha]|uniref:Uncharacterized protein n=1 Tax=Euphydryas editha TaxID=104508 RepID=A0AAU9TKH6_EUPED|nr:unnamed protein product [Euphydryas editha]
MFLQNVKSIWFLSLLFIELLRPVNLQFGIPMYPHPMPPPPAPMLPPPPMMMAPAMVAVLTQSSEETTTTTKKTIKIYPVHPAFCCSVKKKNKSENVYAIPVPVPVPPIVAPPPLVLVPVPPTIPHRKPKKKLECTGHSSDESESSSSTSSSSSEYYRSRGYGRRRSRKKHYRRSPRGLQSDNELLKPMLSFVADNGDVKFETKISNDDVAQLLGKGKQKTNTRIQTEQVLTKENESNKIHKV